MKRWILSSVLVLASLSASQASAAERLIVRVNGGLPIAQAACLVAGCTVVENLDGALNQLFLVTPTFSQNVNAVLAILLRATGVVNAELDLTAHVTGSTAPAALLDKTPVSYYGAIVPHGYVNQPAVDKIRLGDARAAYPNATGTGIVAIIDTGVDPHHPAFAGTLLPGYDFTRNQNGADETLDITLPNAPVIAGAGPQWVSGDGSGDVSQSTAACVDQSTAAVVDGNPNYSDFGHGTMVAGVVHLIAPKAKILPLKAFRSDGTGYTSDILRAIYRAIELHANVINMSFNLASYSQEVATALYISTVIGTISVAAAGNSGQQTLVYPAALQNVMGVAATSDDDQLSTFSNYGSQLVWLAAPGEAIVTTYPFSTYAAGWGTSFSAPFVSGLAAAMRSMNDLCDQYEGAGSAAHAKPIGPDAGHGRLDTFQALQSWAGSIGAH